MSPIDSKPDENCTTWKLIKQISVPNCQKIEDDGEKKHRSETSITKFFTAGTRELRHVQWSRITGD